MNFKPVIVWGYIFSALMVLDMIGIIMHLSAGTFGSESGAVGLMLVVQVALVITIIVQSAIIGQSKDTVTIFWTTVTLLIIKVIYIAVNLSFPSPIIRIIDIITLITNIFFIVLIFIFSPIVDTGINETEKNISAPQLEKTPASKPQKSFTTTEDMITNLSNFHNLLQAGAITQEEYDEQKKKLLSHNKT